MASTNDGDTQATVKTENVGSPANNDGNKVINTDGEPNVDDIIKVIVDTDIGTDPDDGLALAYLALQPRCNLLGVTIVTGDVQQRAAVAQVLLRAMGPKAADIPIHCGRRDAILEGEGQKQCQQYSDIQKEDHVLNRLENTAVDFIRRTIHENLNEVVVLTIGPLSNLGLLFALEPEIASATRDVEWNIAVDRTAAGIVLATRRPSHRFVGLDATRQVAWTKEEYLEFEDKVQGELKSVLQKLSRWWMSIKPRMTFHDPLAAAAIFEPGLCKWKSGHVAVDPRNAMVTFTESEGDPI
ncbi:inosine/uridine-preferring nucleoside hydrolase [Apiospora phragmitis]|uniref:Inosine/uridine-preferring nucleoside hydrolase n=1 Tax=Apiospora phragmitis TaxID=2905665 RepID=A0ABR1T404_9PEZI